MQYQSYAYGKNHWLVEPDLRAILNSYWPDLPQHEAELERFGVLAGAQAYELAAEIDRAAQPVLVMHDVDGRRIDRARLLPAHTKLLKEMAFINRPPYDGGSWHLHFAYGYLLADPGLYCSLIVTNQTAYAIHKYAPERAGWLADLLSGEMWGATWMTETQGGSDLGANTTQARLEAGAWRLYGQDKYFASNAGLADLAIVTARPEGAPPGPKGIALFLVPRLDDRGQLNFHVRRLKAKSATRAVPTGEVEFAATQAYLIGTAELGIYYTLENLTVSRLANAIGAMGLARKAHIEAALRADSRSTFGKKLRDHPLIRHDLTDFAVRTAAGLALVFHAIQAFDRSWHQTPPYSSEYHYARFLSHLAKNRTAEHSDHLTRLGMEVFGGLGFLDEYPLARLHREALVTAIWEGASNIQALDMLEAIQKKGAHETFLDEFVPLLTGVGAPTADAAIKTMQATLAELASHTTTEAQWLAKDALRRLADAAQVGLLYRLAEYAGERYAQLAELYAHKFLLDNGYPSWALEAQGIWDLFWE